MRGVERVHKVGREGEDLRVRVHAAAEAARERAGAVELQRREPEGCEPAHRLPGVGDLPRAAPQPLHYAERAAKQLGHAAHHHSSQILSGLRYRLRFCIIFLVFGEKKSKFSFFFKF